MARRDCEKAFAAAAAEDGITLTGQWFPWLCEQGHTALPESAARAALASICEELGGDPDVLAVGRSVKLTGDFLHEPTGTLLEVDEVQHFTTARLQSLELYPAEFELGLDLEEYKALCRRWRSQGDRAYAHKDARGFGPRGRQRQRAYYDALRDLATPAMGHPPLIRVEALTDNGRGAYRQHRDRLLQLLS
ncbi:MAG: hypothetical protein WBP81_16305 [Solirubrobacteraceae bacterium]